VSKTRIVNDFVDRIVLTGNDVLNAGNGPNPGGTPTPPSAGSGPLKTARSTNNRPLSALSAMLHYRSFGAALATALTLIVFSIWAPYFLTVASLSSALTSSAELGIVCVGVTLLMIAGEFDVSVGSVLGLCAVIAALALEKGVAAPVAVVGSLLVAAVIGFINGILATRTVVPSLIITLGGLLFYRGIVLGITGGFPVVLKPDPFLNIFSGSLFGFEVSAFWFLGLIVIAQFVLFRTGFGNWISATGGNARAALQLGVPTRWVKVVLFSLTSVLAALTGIIQMTRFASVDALRGQGVELVAIAAVVVGGTRLTGGRGSVAGTAFGVITFGLLQVGLQLAQVPSYFYDAFVGLLLIVATVINLYSDRRGE
jgi:simple sugar transport system permease protein